MELCVEERRGDEGGGKNISEEPKGGGGGAGEPIGSGRRVRVSVIKERRGGGRSLKKLGRSGVGQGVADGF